MRKQDVYVVVGNGYEDFARHGNVLTATKLRHRLVTPGQWSGAKIVVLGLGLGHSEKLDLQRSLSACEITWRASWSEPAAGRLTHKVSEENALISPPRRLGPGLFEFDLVLSDAVDRLSGHVTGQHVGAIPLMKAARKAGIAVLEMEFLRWRCRAPWDGGRCLRYQVPQLRFPTAHESARAGPRGRIRDLATSRPPNSRGGAGGRVCCDIRLDVRMFASAALEEIEASSAKKVLNATLSQWGRP